MAPWQHLSDHYVMVKVGNHCLADCTSTLYIRIVLAPSTVMGCHKDVTPLCCSVSSRYPCSIRQTLSHSESYDWDPHPLHTHSRSSLYIYNAIRIGYCGYRSKGCNPTLIFTLWGNHVGQTLGPTSLGKVWDLMIETPTHFILISGLLYIYI
jgi:hypothetical protein